MSDSMKMLAAAAARLERQRLAECFDSNNLDSRPSAKQLEILKDIGKVRVRYLTAGNQCGKSSAGVREMAWILNDNHPWWKKPKDWGNGPLFMAIAGQSRNNIEEELWKRKLKPLLLDKEDWKEKRVGGIVISVTNERNGNSILFLVHGQGTEETRAQLQGYRFHYVLFDEMPKDYSTFTEIEMRIDAYRGYLFVAFTPLLKNLQMKNAIENAKAPYSKKYIWTVWDNPNNLSPDKRLEIEQRASSWSESERRIRLYGEWASDDQTVFYFNMDEMCEPLPSTYSYLGWRHLVSADPALSSNTGLIVMAEDPKTKIWYVNRGEYISGDSAKAPTKVVQEVYGRILDYNVVRYASDIAPWFVNAAREAGLTFMQPWNKTQRKEELIKNLQEALSSGKLKVDPSCTLLIEEFLTCRWSETAENKIVSHQKYHLLDALQYAWDLKPRPEGNTAPVAKTRDAWIMQEWEKQLKKEAAVAKAKEASKAKFRIQQRSRIWVRRR